MLRRRTIILILLTAGILFVVVHFHYSSRFIHNTELPCDNNSTFHYSKDLHSENALVKLKGDVEFYWDTLLSPEDFSKANTPVPSAYIKIPGKWNDYDGMDIEFSGHGYGTYHFKIVVPENELYGIKLKDFKSADKIWINHVHYEGKSIVANNKKDMHPSRNRQEIFFQSENKEIDVVIQVSNFHHRNGGSTDFIFFGPAQEIYHFKQYNLSIDAFLVGVFFILFVYHMSLYFYRKKDLSILYFSLLSLAMMLRTGYTGENALLEAAAFIPWGITVRLEYISLMVIPTFTILFIQKLFIDLLPKFLVKTVVYTSIASIAIVIFGTPTLFSYSPNAFLLIIAPCASYMLILLFIATIRKRKYALAIFSGYFIFFAFSINDLLHYNQIISSMYLMSLGLLFLTLAQAYILALKTSSAFTSVELLSDKLAKHANELEGIVEERTKLIRDQKEEIESSSEELKVINSQLQEMANYKREMTNMMVHDLKNPLGNILGFTSLPEIEKHREIIHASGWEMQNLIQNILDVEKYESTDLNLNIEPVSLHSIVDKAYHQTQYHISLNKITFSNTISTDLMVSIDKEFFYRVFSNIISNATKYGCRNGKIEVSSKNTEINKKEYCKINIYNTGKKIPEEMLNQVFQKYSQLHDPKGQYRYSSGIGLNYCRIVVEAHGGKIGARNDEKEGVHFWFTIPV